MVGGSIFLLCRNHHLPRKGIETLPYAMNPINCLIVATTTYPARGLKLKTYLPAIFKEARRNHHLPRKGIETLFPVSL